MPLYQYIKAPPTQKQLVRSSKSIPLWRRLIPLSMFTAGLVALSYVAWPIISYQLIVAPSYKITATARPIPDNYVISPINSKQAKIDPLLKENSPLYPAVALASEPQVLDNPFDLTNPANWFPGAPAYANQSSGLSASTIKEYALTIPKIGVEDARVVVGGGDLSQYMIHYGGTALPGEFGNAVVFCHSTLPQFFNHGRFLMRRFIEWEAISYLYSNGLLLIYGFPVKLGPKLGCQQI